MLTRQVLESAIELAQRGREDDLETQRNLAALAHLFVAGTSRTRDEGESDDAVSALDAMLTTHTELELNALRRWMLALSATSKSTADREALIATIARSGSRAAVFDSEAFRGLSLDALGELLSLEEF